MALPGIPIPDDQCIGDSLISINNALTTLDASVTAAASSGVTKITAGAGVSVSPSGGTGDVTVTNVGATKITAGSNIYISSTGSIGGTGEVTINASSFSLPCRLGEYSCSITNWDNATTNGWYMGSDASNAPGLGWYMGYVQAHNAGWTTQIVHQFAGNNSTWIREQNNGVWSNWTSTKGSAGSVSNSAPSEALAGDIWLDADSGVTYIFDGSNWRDIARGIGSVNGIVRCDGNGNFSAATFTDPTPTGAVMYFASPTAPNSGWIGCDGAVISNSGVEANLYNFLAAAGWPFGGVGRIPDLRGKFIRSNGSDGTYSSSVLGTTQADAFKSHRHTGGWTTGGGIFYSYKSEISTYYMGNTSTGYEGSTETRPANVALLACIKL